VCASLALATYRTVIMLLDELHLNDFTSIKHLQWALKVVFMHVWPEEFSCTDPVLTSSASSVCDASKQ